MKSIMSARRFLVLQLGWIGLIQVVVTVALVGGILLPQIRRDLGVRHETLARSIAGQITAHLMGAEHQLRSASEFMESQPAMPADQRFALLDAQCGTGETFETIYMADVPEETVSSVGLPHLRRRVRNDILGMDLSGRDFIRTARELERPVWSETFLSTVSSRLAVALIVPSRHHTAIGEITVDNLSAFTSRLAAAPDLVVLILDGHGRVVADSHRSLGGRHLRLENLPPATRNTSRGAVSLPFALDGSRFIGNLVTVDTIGWHVLVAQNRETALQPVRHLMMILAGVLLISFGMAFAVSWYQTGRLSRLISQYADHAQAIARGQYDLTWPAVRTAEFTNLAENLKRMARNIKSREQKIRKGRELLNQITDNVPGVVYQFRAMPGHQYTNSFISNKSLEIFGLDTTVENFFERFFACIPDDEKDRFQSSVRSAVDRVVPWQYEGRFHKPSGESIWFSGRAAPHMEGDTVVFNGVLLDITKRKDLEKSLRLTQFAFDTASVGIYRIGEDARIMDVNRQAARSLGYTHDELCRMTVFDIDPNLPRDRWATHRQNLRSRGPLTIETSHRRKDGTRMPVEIVVNLLEYENEQFSITFVRDLTAQKEAEKSAKRMEAALVQAQKMEAVGTLAGGIAHDFNNILSGIIGYTELSLLDTEKPSQINDNLQRILAAGLRARELVNRILAFSRQNEKDLQPVLLGSLVKEALKLIRSTLPSTVDIIQHIDPDPDAVMADPTQIHQIVMNLCTNAAHAMEKDGGELIVSVRRIRLADVDTDVCHGLDPGAFVKLSVQDTGTGMSENVIDRIFDPYFTTKEKGKGTGLGLSVVHGIVKSYNGGIAVRSEVGRGTVFEVFLPVIEASTAAKGGGRAPHPTGDEHILVVDDEAMLVDVVQRILEGLGYRVTAAKWSPDALDLFRKTPDRFDLVLTDMTMPKMNGEKLISEIRSIRNDIPFILCTGYRYPHSDLRLKELNVMAVLNKPIQTSELAETVRRVLDEWIRDGMAPA